MGLALVFKYFFAYGKMSSGFGCISQSGSGQLAGTWAVSPYRLRGKRS